MTLSDLGKRFERLLTLALPISVLCLATSFAQLAHYQYTRNSERVALKSFSEIVLGLRTDLDKFFLDTKKPKSTPSYQFHHAIISWKEPYLHEHAVSYSAALAYIQKAAEKQHGTLAQAWLASFVDSKKSPEQIVSSVQLRMRELDGTVRMGDIVVPINPDVSVLGTKVTFPLKVVGAFGYLASCLALILWFGTMRLTRRREMLGLLSTQFRNQPFPHLLNSTMTVLASHPKAARGRSAKFNKAAHKMSLVVVRTTVVALIALLTILPLVYTSLFLQFNFDELEPIGQQILPFWFLVVVGFVPVWQLSMLWIEEMYWLALAPIRMLLLGRDVLV